MRSSKKIKKNVHWLITSKSRIAGMVMPYTTIVSYFSPNNLLARVITTQGHKKNSVKLNLEKSRYAFF